MGLGSLPRPARVKWHRDGGVSPPGPRRSPLCGLSAAGVIVKRLKWSRSGETRRGVCVWRGVIYGAGVALKAAVSRNPIALLRDPDVVKGIFKEMKV